MFGFLAATGFCCACAPKANATPSAVIKGMSVLFMNCLLCSHQSEADVRHRVVDVAEKRPPRVTRAGAAAWRRDRLAVHFNSTVTLSIFPVN